MGRGLVWTLALLALILPAATRAGCEGRDLVAELAREDPDAHAALFARGRAYVHGQGKLYEVWKPGIAPSVVMGTYHDTGIAEEPLAAAALHALDTADRLVVEITPAEQKKLRQRIANDPTFAFAADGTSWADLMSPDQRTLAEKALRKRGLELEAAARMKPWMLMSVLGVPKCQLAAMAAGKPVLDAMLVQRAQARGIPVLGLEGYTAAVSAFELIDLEELKTLAVDMMSQLGEEEDARASMIGLYRAGEIGTILEFGILQSTDLVGENRARKIAGIFREAIITHRNREWMDRLEAALAQGNTFVAFGALHLIGEEGVLALLEKRGWNVLRLDG